MAIGGELMANRWYTVAQLTERWGLTKARVHQMIDENEWAVETPCDRCGSRVVLVAGKDVDREDKKRGIK